MNEEKGKERQRLDKIVKSRIKGLGLDALFHLVDVSKKDEQQSPTKRHLPSFEELHLIERLKQGLPANMGELIASKDSIKVILDIGTSSIKLIELKRSKEKTLLSKAIYIPIPHIVANAPEKLEKFIIDSLAQSIDAKAIKNSYVSTILPRTKAIVKFITLPTKETEEIKKMLEFEAEHHLPFSLSEAEIDYHIIKQRDNNTEIALAAIKKNEISSHLALLNKLNVPADTIELSAIAAYNSALPYLPKEGVLVQMNIGAAYTDINIIKDGILSFSRGISWGSNELTTMISQNLNIGFDDAEKIKKENGIILLANEDNTKKAISDTAVAWVEQLSNDINQTINSFQLQEGVFEIKQITLSGGGSRLSNLNEYLRDKFKTKVTVQDAYKDIEFEYPAQDYSKYARELNLLLGPLWKDSCAQQLDINLLPEGIKRSLQLKQQKRKAVIYSTIIALVLCLFFLLPAGVAKLRDGQINRLNRRLTQLKPEIASVNDLKDKIQTVEDYISTKQSCMEILREISVIISSDIIINGFTFEKYASVSLTGSAQSHASAVNFSKTLGESRFFESAKLQYTRKKDIPGKEEVDFEIICNLVKSKNK